MNTTKQVTMLCVALWACAGLARADEGGTVTREQVKAELQAARDSGEAAALVGEDGGSFWLAQHTPPTVLTRQQVRERMLAERSSIDWAGLNSEDGGSMAQTRRATPPYAGPDLGSTRHAGENKAGKGS